MAIEVKKLAKPDEVRKFSGHGRAEIYNFEGGAVGRGIFEPGWRWSQDVKPVVGTPSCEVHHTLYVLKGRMRVRMNDGTEDEFGPGDLAVVTPGHDAWVVGDEAVEALDFTGATHYAKAREVEAEAGAAAPH